MSARRGYLLLALGVIFSLMALSAGVSWLDRRTVFQRDYERSVRRDLDHLRLGIDLFIHRATVTAPSPASLTALENGFADADVNAVIRLLAGDRHLSQRVASGSWRIVRNLVKNPSFEFDNGTDYGGVATSTGTWQGNRTSGDFVPDGWTLVEDGIEQYLQLTGSFPASFVASFWARMPAVDTTVRFIVAGSDGSHLLDIIATSTEWRRYQGSFGLAAPETVRLLTLLSSTGGTDHGLVDGVMLERWWNPLTAGGEPIQPVPSAWTANYGISPLLASPALHLQWFTHQLDAAGRQATEAWVFQF